MSSVFVGDSVGLRGDHATSIQPFQRMTKDSTAVAVVIEGRPRGVKFNVMDLQGKERGIYPDEAIVAGQFEVVSVEEVPTGSDVPVTRVVRVRPSDAAIQASAFVDPFACHDAACAPPPVGTGGSKSVTVYHLTDDPKFAPRADFVPEDNTVTIRERTSPGLYVAKDSWDIEKWVNGSGYLRPYVAEISVPEDAMTDERWGGEGFIPGENLGRVEVKRLLPIDAFARETYGDYGWVEDTLGAKFDTGEPVPTDNSVRYAEGGRPVGYIYDGPDVRDMPAAETERLAKDAEKALGIRTGTTASADPFAGLEVYGFACRSKECAPPPVGKGGSSPGVGTSAEALFDLAAAHMKQPTKPGSIWGATDAKVELKRQLGLIFDHSIKYGYQSKVGWINPLGDRAISVHGNIFSKKGKEVGSFKFVLFKDDSGMWADFDIITLKNEYLGKGIGGRFYVRAEEGLRNAGFNRIELHAANNLGHQLGALRGASAWGRFGFDWDPRHLGDVVELRRKEARALSPSYVATGTGPREHYQIAVRFDEFADRIQAARQSGETYTLRDDDPTPAEVFELAGIKYADNIGWHGVKQLTSPATTAAASPSRQARLDAIAAFYMAAARDAETDELPDMPDTLLAACHDASCAPPPVGTGGSSPGVDHGPPYADIEGIANGHDYATYHEELMREGDTVQILDAETATYAQAQVQDAEVVVRITTDRLSDIINYSEPEDWELRSLHDPENEVGRSLREETYLQHRDVYDSAVGFDLGHVVHGYSEAEFRLDPVIPEGETSPYGHLYHRASPRGAAWYGEIQLVMTDEARDDATFTVSDSLNSGSVPLPIEGPIDPRAAALNGVHRHNFGNAYVEVQLRAPIELSSKYVKEIRVPDLYTLQDVSHVLVERMPDTIVTIEDDGIQMSMKNAVKALEEIS
jgi:GNAT superfamily N-acetyltransferase